MKYSRKYKTNWHDTDASGNVRITRMLVYMQETSSAHVRECGGALSNIREKKGLTFILSRISLSVYAPLRAYADIDVETWTCPSRGFSLVRCYRILCGDTVIVEAHTVWALVDIKNKSLCRFNDVGYSFDDEEPLALDMPQRFRLPPDCELVSVGKRRIAYSDLDYNMHMNNTKYPDMLCDFIDIDDVAKIKGMTLSYLHESAFGDTLDILRAEKDGTYYFRTVGQSGVCLEAQVFLDK